MAILNDLDKMTYTIKPAAKQNMAVRVPDWNMPHKTAIVVSAKNILSFFIFVVIAIMVNVEAAAAALQP